MCSGDEERLREGNRIGGRDDVRRGVHNKLREFKRSGNNRRHPKI